MKYLKYKNDLLIFLIVLSSVFFVTILWSKINVPYFNKYEVIGIYSSLNYSSYNDVLRYTFFISVPVLSYIVALYFFKKKEFVNLTDLLSLKKNKYIPLYPTSKITVFYFFIFFLLIINEFFSLDMPNFKMDYWHDGDYLTAAKNYSITQKIWGSTYAVHGASMAIYPSLMWKLFNIESIGAYRLFPWFLIIILKLLCVYFAYLLSRIVLIKKIYKDIFFIIFGFLILSMSNFGSLADGYNLISFRDLYLILFLIFLFNIIILDKINFFNISSITIIPSITMLLHTDIGIYLNFTLFILVLYFIFLKQKKIIFNIFFIFSCFWLITIFLLGYEEFSLFIRNIPIMASSIDYLHGWVYPEPFFDIGNSKHASRATKGLFFQLLAGLIISYKVFIKDDHFDNRKKIFFLFVFILSFIFYRTALGRSDAFHIRMSGDLPLLIISFFILEYFLRYFEKIKLFSNEKLLKYFIISIFTISFFYLSYDKFNFNNVKNIKYRYTNFINLSNESFMDKDVIELVNYFKDISLGDNCIQNFTNNHAIPYFLNKKSCTPYYASILASPNILQHDYVLRIKKSKPAYILYASEKFTFDNIKVYDRLKIVNNYINQDYIYHKNINGYTIYKSIELN